MSSCRFSDFDAYHVVDTWAGASLSLMNCSFDNKNLLLSDNVSAMIRGPPGNSWDDVDVRLEGCTFNNNVERRHILLFSVLFFCIFLYLCTPGCSVLKI